MKNHYQLFLRLFFLFGSLTGVQAQDLLHYWNFNDVSSLQAHLSPTFTLINGAGIAQVQDGSSLIDLTGGTGQNFDVQNLNARNNAPAGNHLRFNFPLQGKLIFSVPSTSYRDVVIKYVTRRSSSGAGIQVIDYSLDGVTFSSFAQRVITEVPTLETLDFSGVAGAANNPSFQIRISFLTGAGGEVGNNRFDNFTVEGNSLSGGDSQPPVTNFDPAPNSLNVPVEVQPTITFNEDVRLIDNTPLSNANVNNVLELKTPDANGSPVSFSASVSGRVITVTPTAPLASGQTYYLALKPNTLEDASDNAITDTRFTTFTTLPQQTTFAAGDLAFVAYQMNVAAPNNTDRFAFLSFVNILPGTRIQFTDNKVTTHSPAQCPGGFVWIAPATGIKAGTVVTISENGLSHGTIEGSIFGLGAGGDQVIVYAGTPEKPNYITALSSNGWIEINTVCNGGLSMRPAGLTDGVNALNMSTAPGNVAGVTPNAYYNGSTTLEGDALKQALHNPANWVGAASGTEQQSWPVWGFGAPTVVSASVLSSTRIRIIFSKDLDPVSATTAANYAGIASLSNISVTANGALPDTVILQFSAPFVSGTSYTLNVSGVQDADGNPMATPFNFPFTYNTAVSLSTNLVSVSEGDGVATFKVLIQNPSVGSVDLKVKYPLNSTAWILADYRFYGQRLKLDGNSTEITIEIPIVNDRWPEADEYFFLQLENPVGCTISGTPHVTLYIRDNDRVAKAPTNAIELAPVSSVDVKTGAGSNSAEIAVYDPDSRRLFVVNSLSNSLVMMNFANPAAPAIINTIQMNAYGLGINSVAVKNGLVACAVESKVSLQDNGSVVFFNTNGTFLKQVSVGAMPDMITFTPDGNKVLTANEGEPNDAYTIDPEGSISIIDISKGIDKLSQSQVTTLNFRAYNGKEEALRARGIRVYPGRAFAQDAEPEYITVSEDSKTAWVVLQENNAFAVIDLKKNVLADLWPLGYKNHMKWGNSLDASDQGGQIHLSNWPIKGVYMPDAIASYKQKGNTYLVGANEGDDREWSGDNERRRFASADIPLDPKVFPHAEILKQNFNLGRLNVTRASGKRNAAGEFQEVHVVGGRSFAIWDAEDKKLVYDSGDDFELFFSQNPLYRPIFNSNHEANNFKARSSSKGPEPEGVTLAKIKGRTYAFVSLERIGGIMVYDITSPKAVEFVHYSTSRRLDTYGGDNGTEGIIYIAPEQSPDGNAYVVCANEISSTVSVYKVKAGNKPGKNARLEAGENGEAVTEVGFYVYPNPANHTLHLNRISSVEIYSISGLKVLSAANTANVDISQLAPGMYLIRTDNGLVTKFMKE